MKRIVSGIVTEHNGAPVEVAFEADRGREFLRLRLGRESWAMAIVRAWDRPSDYGTGQDLWTQVDGVVQEAAPARRVALVIDCGRTPPLLSVSLATENGSGGAREFLINHEFQEEVLHLIASVTAVEHASAPIDVEKQPAAAIDSR